MYREINFIQYTIPILELFIKNNDKDGLLIIRSINMNLILNNILDKKYDLIVLNEGIDYITDLINQKNDVSLISHELQDIIKKSQIISNDNLNIINDKIFIQNINTLIKDLNNHLDMAYASYEINTLKLGIKELSKTLLFA